MDIEPPLAGEWDPEGEWFGGQDTVQYKPIQLPNFLEPGEIIALRSPFESRAPGSWTGLSFSCQSRFMCVAHGLARALAAHYRGNGGRGDHCDVEPGGENAASIYCDYHQLEELIDEGGRVWEHHQLTVHLRLDDEDGLTSTLQLRALYADGYLAPNRVADYRFDFERDRHGDFTRYLTVIKNWVQATLRALVDKHIGGVG